MSIYRESVGTRGLKLWGSPFQMQRGPGYQIDWERVSEFYQAGKVLVKINGAVAVGADAITVDPLTTSLRKGDTINFPDAETVVVTLDAALINATSVGCDPLTGPIPSGAILKTADSQEFLRLTAAAAEGAETLTVEAIPNALEGGETATYQGQPNILEVLEDVIEGATSVPVQNVAAPLADNAEGYTSRRGFSGGDKFIPEGTIMALDATSRQMFPRRDAVAETAIGFLASDASNSRQHACHSLSGYGTVIGGTFIYENLAPDADGSGDVSSTYKTELQTNTLGFIWKDYVDTRA